MNSRVVTILGLLGASLAFSQTTTAPTPPPNPPPAQSTSSSASSLKPRGPEAVAEQDPNRVVATIDGKPITAKQALELLKPVQAADRKRFEKNLDILVQQIYMQDQVAAEASKMNLDQQSPWKEELEMAKANILTQAYLTKMSASGPGQDPKQYYDAHLADFDRVKVSGILVAYNPPGTPAASATTTRTEDQAQQKANDLESKLKAGGDFAALARTESDNQASSVKGGEIGTFVLAETNIPAEIKTALAKLQPGQISDPVKVTGGYYILKVDSRDKVPFEEAKDSITQKLQTDRQQAVLQQELGKYKVQVQDRDFFNMANAPAPTPSLIKPAGTAPQTPVVPNPPTK